MQSGTLGAREAARSSQRAAAELLSDAETRYREQREEASRLRRFGGAVAIGSYGGTVMLISVVMVTPYLLKALLHNDDVDSSSSSDNAKTSHFLPLYVPLAGPIWTLSYSDINKEFGNCFWFGLLGAGQLAGSIIYVTGVVNEPKKTDAATAASSVSVVSLFDARGNRGIGVVGRF